MVIGTAAVGGGDHHDVSIVMVGACRGGQPASKVSMMAGVVHRSMSSMKTTTASGEVSEGGFKIQSTVL